MDIIMPFLLITTFWGASVGKKNGLRFWLYGSGEGFAASLWVAFGFWISLGGGFLTVIGLGILIWAAIALYKITDAQVYTGSKFDMWMLYFGKMSFSIMTAGLLFLLAILFGARKS